MKKTWKKKTQAISKRYEENMEKKDPGCQRYEERAVESLRGMKKEP